MSDNEKHESYFNDEDARIIAERVAAIKAQKAAKAREAAEAPTRAVESAEPKKTPAQDIDEIIRIRREESQKRAADNARKVAEKARLDAEIALPEDEKEDLLNALDKVDKAEVGDPGSSGFKYKMVDSETAEIDSEIISPPEEPAKKESARGRAPDKKKKKGPKASVILLIVAAVLLLAAAGMIAFYFLSGGMNNPFYTMPIEQALTGEGHTYTVDSPEKLALYLKHPSLLPSDTLILKGDMTLDVDESFGGYLSMPLVNFDTSGGKLTLTGGSVVMSSGRSDSVDMSGVSILDSNVLIEAPNTSLTWNGASAYDSTINVANLNGSEHLRTINVKAVGTKFTVPVTVYNKAGANISSAELTLSSDAFVFCEGNTVSVSDLKSGGSVTLQIPVIATQGGRHKITVSGNGVTGESAYIDVLGKGYYSGDLYVYTFEEKNYEQYTHAIDAARRARELGFSFLGSTGKSVLGEVPSDSEIASVAGNDRFLVVPMMDVTTQNGGIMFLGYPEGEEAPSVDYEKVDGVQLWTFQDSVRQGHDLGAIGIITHPFSFGKIQDKIDQIYVTRQYYGLGICEPGAPYESMEWRVGMNVWDNVNSQGRMRCFAFGGSATGDVGCVGYNYISGYMGNLTSDSLMSVVKGGNYYATNGPALTFELGSKHMGESFTAREGERVSLRIAASADTPIKTISVYRYDVTYQISDLHPETIVTYDFTGQDVYSYSENMSIAVVPTSYYRLVVTCESPKVEGSDEVGYAVSNPIWVDEAQEKSANASLLSVTYTGDSEKDLSEIKVAEDGTYYIDCHDGVFSPGGITVETSGTSSIDYHLNKSDLLADYVTIHILAEDGKTSASETIYIVNHNPEAKY